MREASPPVEFGANRISQDIENAHSARLAGPCSGIVRLMRRLGPHWAASANVLTSGLVRSLTPPTPPPPEEFRRALWYSALSSDSEKGPDTNHPLNLRLWPFAKTPSYLRQSYSYLETSFSRRRLVVRHWRLLGNCPYRTCIRRYRCF